MKIVVLFDIYGNFVVFDVVFDDVCCCGVDVIVNFGDIVFGVFYLVEMVDCLIVFDLLIVKGNYEW